MKLKLRETNIKMDNTEWERKKKHNPILRRTAYWPSILWGTRKHFIPENFLAIIWSSGVPAFPMPMEWTVLRENCCIIYPCIIYVRITHREPSTFFSFSLSCDKTGYKQSKILYPLHWNSSYQEMEHCWFCAGLVTCFGQRHWKLYCVSSEASRRLALLFFIWTWATRKAFKL